MALDISLLLFMCDLCRIIYARACQGHIGTASGSAEWSFVYEILIDSAH